ncbi:dolichyl-phosphate beta-glucosyltransferase [Chitinophaga terrae (ex Kim and Jung 2007)]|uniref:dolichyl-phosphate beta-glucosyltransferase n=1 Tax=Chitinophaga terrae (ex Kim and Jung 2007) TaxID=408074 RepID=UPI000B7CA1DD|nr:dolichyl-phosphate beta-glucosyltransferase [Chitinophaga terrae (ex Kim and Jung 2007)]
MKITPLNFEIIVVDDGSTDTTASIAKKFSNYYGHTKVISYFPNKGKGFAVKTGVLAAEGNLILYNDADGSAPIQELCKLEEQLLLGYDIALGSRNKDNNGSEVQFLLHRKIIGTLFNTLVKVFLVREFHDTQCGFKLFTKESAKNVFPLLTEQRFAFDIEVLFIAKHLGYKASEVGINWSNVKGSKVNLILDSYRMFISIFKVRVRRFKSKNTKVKQLNYENPNHLEMNNLL